MTFYELHDGPMTLQRFTREGVGAGLRDRYKPEPGVPKQFLALLEQMKRDERAQSKQNGNIYIRSA
jgi:hypothetical protein